jgi:uncharacterized phage protein (TIGR02218 family)
MQAHLDDGATTLCWCWMLIRHDGLVQGFTDHDRPLSFDGVTYDAVSGFTASQIESSLGLAVDNLTLAGALSSTSLNEADLAAGLYDDAAIRIWRVNWAEPGQRVLLKAGTLGEVTRVGHGFQAEIRGLAQALNQPVGRVFGHLCDADLGDARCGVHLAVSIGTIAIAYDSRRFSVAGLGSFATGWFDGGKLTFTTGVNAGRAMEIKRHAVTGAIVTIELWQSMSAIVADGDAFTVTPGCDKQLVTCQTKFSNAVNFQGFPHMPGNDAVLAAPMSGKVMDGGSRYGN